MTQDHSATPFTSGSVAAIPDVTQGVAEAMQSLSAKDGEQLNRVMFNGLLSCHDWVHNDLSNPETPVNPEVLSTPDETWRNIAKHKFRLVYGGGLTTVFSHALAKAALFTGTQLEVALVHRAALAAPEDAGSWGAEVQRRLLADDPALDHRSPQFDAEAFRRALGARSAALMHEIYGMEWTRGEVERLREEVRTLGQQLGAPGADQADFLPGLLPPE